MTGCHACGASPATGETLWRQNAKGIPGIFACRSHLHVRRCSVDGCKRRTTRLRGLGEWICPVHWARITKAERRVLFRAKRQAKRWGWLQKHERIWRALVRRAALPG